MSVQRYTVDQDGDLVKAKYGGLVNYSGYLILEAKYLKLLEEKSSAIDLYMVTFVTVDEGIRSHSPPTPFSNIIELLEKYLNDPSFTDVKVYAIKPAVVETTAKTTVTSIKV